ncbi:MAG: hypothetical protein K0S07_1761 [Chlamydiales bacterium]|nr:hypothetical protein [Chlamydiales bacterium]
MTEPLTDRLRGNEPISYEFHQMIKDLGRPFIPEERMEAESFHLFKNRSQFVIRARHPLGARYGSHLLETVNPSGHLGEYLKDSRPRFALRTLWLEGKLPVEIKKGVWLDLPACLASLSSGKEPEELAKSFSSILFRLGYNALILGAVGACSIGKAIDKEESGLELPLEAISSFLGALRRFGIQVILKPRWQRNFSLSGLELFLGSDPLFFEGQMPDLADKRLKEGNTSYDLIIKEVRLIEEALAGKPLIYYCQTSQEAAKRQSLALNRLVDDVKGSTTLAFSAKAGDPCEGSLPLHPFFNALRASPDTSSTPLLPIVNAGALKSGEGLWPLLTIEESGKVAKRLYRHCFAGMICLTAALPDETGLLDCSLWVASQLMWQDRDAELLAETWFLAKKPEMLQALTNHLFTRLSDMVRAFWALKGQINQGIWLNDSKQRLESMLLSLQQILEESGEGELSTYLLAMQRDIKKLLIAYLQQSTIPIPNQLSQIDNKPSFWASPDKPGASSFRWQARERPLADIEDPKLLSVYQQNRLFD